MRKTRKEARPRMAPKRSKKSRKAHKHKRSIPNSKAASSKRLKPQRHLTASQASEKVRTFDAANLYRQRKAKSVSGAARMAGTNLSAMWRWIPDAIEKDPRTGRLRIKPSDRYSARVEIVTDAG